MWESKLFPVFCQFSFFLNRVLRVIFIYIRDIYDKGKFESLKNGYFCSKSRPCHPCMHHTTYLATQCAKCLLYGAECNTSICKKVRNWEEITILREIEVSNTWFLNTFFHTQIFRAFFRVHVRTTYTNIVNQAK